MTADGTSPREPQPPDFGLSAERAALLDHPYERVTDSLFKSRTFWTVYLLALAFILYMLTGSVALTVMLGLLLGVLGAWMVPIFAGAILLLPLGAVWKRLQSDYPSFTRFQAAKVQYTRDLAEWMRTQEQWWRSLTGTAFEIEVGRVFQRSGYVVERTGRAGDQGVDLLLRKDGRSVVAQCKAHKKPVGPAVVRDLYGTLVHHRHQEAWLVSTSGFTPGAKRFAQGKPIRLVALGDLLREVRRTA
jgi:hypothetical protein